MSLSLTLYFDPDFQHPDWKSKPSWTLYNEVQMFGGDTLFKGITRLKPNPLPEGMTVTIRHDDGYTTTDSDAYGTPLTYLTAGQFRKLKKMTDTYADRNQWNASVMAMIAVLPENSPVLLYWH
jgi:hypothetical protein